MNQTDGTRMYVNKVPAATGRCLSKIVVDVTSPSATTDIDLKTAMNGPPGAVAMAHELDKFTRTIDANVAVVNGFEYMPVAIEKDTGYPSTPPTGWKQMPTGATGPCGTWQGCGPGQLSYAWRRGTRSARIHRSLGSRQ